MSEKRKYNGMPMCTKCGNEMEIATVKFPIFVGGNLESVSGEGMKCPSCGYERLIWHQYKAFEKMLREKLEEVDKTGEKKYCMYCKYQVCQPAALRYFCGNTASSEYNKAPGTLHLDKCCDCFESVFAQK